MLRPMIGCPSIGSPASRAPARRSNRIAFGWMALTAIAWLSIDQGAAEDGRLQRGEAFVTRFSGATSGSDPAGHPVFSIDVNGVVGSIIDLRAPRQAPL